MRNRLQDAAQAGFTLVEVLVTVLILGLLAAVVFPVVADRAGDADPVRVANDLANIRSGVELFQLDVRTVLPGDVEDLINTPSTSGTPSDNGPADADIDGNSYSTGATQKWDGPYVDLALASDIQGASDARLTAFDAQIINAFENRTIDGTDFLLIRLVNLASPDQFNSVDEQIDGGDGGNAGKLRHFNADTADFVVAPIK